MDWSRTKSIFIFVFLILNIFLYSQYINRYEEGQNVEMPGDKSIEANLKEDNITYIDLPNDIEAASFIKGKVRSFAEPNLIQNANVHTLVRDEHILVATLKDLYQLQEINKAHIEQFVSSYVQDGDSYKFWSIDEESNSALFFQIVNGRPLFYNDKGYLKIYWDNDGHIYGYEQAILEQLEEYEQKETIMTPIQVIQILYTRDILKSDSHVSEIELGYSTLVQMKQTQTQVFAPTWEVEIEVQNKETQKKEIQKYYVNASDGKVIDIQGTTTEEEQE